MALTCALVDAGAAVAIMPQLLIDTASRSTCCRELAPAVPPRTIWAALRTCVGRLPAVRAALGALRASIDRPAAGVA